MAGTSGAFDGLSVADVKAAQEALLTQIEQKHKELIKSLETDKPDEATQKKVIDLAQSIARQYHQEKRT